MSSEPHLCAAVTNLLNKAENYRLRATELRVAERSAREPEALVT